MVVLNLTPKIKLDAILSSCIKPFVVITVSFVSEHPFLLLIIYQLNRIRTLMEFLVKLSLDY